MKNYRVPHTDLDVSCIAYGCGSLTAWDSNAISAEERQRAERLVHTAVEQGITLFDHADVYGFGKTETLFGEILKSSPGLRNKVVLQSKCGQVLSPNFQWGQPIYVDLTRPYIETSVEGSLRRLGTEHLDILLLHAPSTLVRPDEVAGAFDHLHDSGKVRYFGVSNYAPAQIEVLKRSVRQPVVANQIQLGLGWPRAFVDGIEFTVDLARGGGSAAYGADAGGVVDYCRMQGIQIQAWQPLRGGFLSPKADSSPALQALAQKLDDVAKSKRTTPAALALAWLLHHPAGIVPISGSGTWEHVVANCAADHLALSDGEWYSLLAAATKLRST